MYMVSIIVAAFNVEQYISRCIKSLINQSYSNLEIIVVNDKSTDETEKICESFTADRRVRIVNKPINEGLSQARNTGINAATGDYIMFVDGDDFLDNRTVEKCIETVKNSSVDEVVFGSSFDRVIANDSYKMDLFASKEMYKGSEEMQLYFKEALGALPSQKNDRNIGFTPWGRLYKKSIFDNSEIRFISERELIYEDLTFFLLSTPHIESVAILNEPLYHYCENTNSLTHKCDVERFSKVKKMYLYIKKIYDKEIFSNTEVILRFHRTMISYIRLSVMQLSHNSNHIKTIKKICADEVTKEIMKDYPVSQLPIKQMFFAGLLKYNHPYLLYYLCHYYVR